MSSGEPGLPILSIDFETRSTVNLKATGVYPYAEHPDTDIWCMAWAFDDEEPQIWWPDHVWAFLHPDSDCDQQFGEECDDCNIREDMMQRVVRHIYAGGEIRAHNAEFERAMWREIMHKRYGFPNPSLEQWHCSAAEAAAMALPRHLEQVCRVTRVAMQKDNEGYNLMMRMCRPRSKKGVRPLVWWYDRERLTRLGEYCKQDVRAEKALTKVTRRLTPLEREHYLEICRQNDAGIMVDVALVRACRAVADEGVRRANAALEELTGGEVEKVTKHEQLRAWVNSKGVETASVAKKVVRELLDDPEINADVREALTIRQESGKSSNAKLDAMLECRASDGKIHGMIVYHGASTGRETGKLVQVHNFARPEIDNPEAFIDAMLREDYDALDLFHPPVSLVSWMLRSTLTATPGNELVGADYSGIEARVVNWFAGQEDMLDRFRALDGGDKSQDPYIINAMRYYGIPFDKVTKKIRQTGKFQELGCGFGMGAKTGQVQAKDVYGLTLTLEETQAMVDDYRASHAEVKKFWRTINDASIRAVNCPGENVTFGPLRNLTFTKRGAYLYLILPSKRPLVYASPRIVERTPPWSTPEKPVTVPAVQIMAVNPKTKQWAPQDMYGGIWTENVVQAAARDLMAEGKLRARAAGYPSVLTVHDEVVTEVPEGYGDVKAFERILTASPAWAAGLPIAAEGWRGFRYRK